ncbi:hypothetical protein T09_3346 [Trichinella sp. T9]|nr:hypothetical protein T09_3346 [Trichinella sp. T9]
MKDYIVIEVSGLNCDSVEVKVSEDAYLYAASFRSRQILGNKMSKK